MKKLKSILHFIHTNLVRCGICHGRGWVNEENPIDCVACGGKGYK